MVWKIIRVAIAAALLTGALCTGASAASHTIYDEGNISSTYVTYFEDIVSGIGFNDNYVAFRSGQYEYTMVVGNLLYSDGVISLEESGKEYRFYTETSGYNSQYRYAVTDITEFSVECGNYIIYSDMGDYPQLVERGAKYEMLSALLLCIFGVCIVINRIFFARKR